MVILLDKFSTVNCYQDASAHILHLECMPIYLMMCHSCLDYTQTLTCSSLDAVILNRNLYESQVPSKASNAD